MVYTCMKLRALSIQQVIPKISKMEKMNFQSVFIINEDHFWSCQSSHTILEEGNSFSKYFETAVQFLIYPHAEAVRFS